MPAFELEAIRELPWHSCNAVEAHNLGALATMTAKRTPKSNRLNNQNNNSARTLHFLVHFFAVSARQGPEIS